VTASLLMRVDLPRETPTPAWPEGTAVRALAIPDAPRLHALLEHGYRNGGGSVAPFESWLPALIGDSEFAPETCFMVVAGDELAAASICWTSGFVKDLVVHETWRRQGLGEALLYLAFQTFQDRGASTVDLKVEVQNAGAIHLYERVGMRIVEHLGEAPGNLSQAL
jgi:ribosomal protein S18 acetylase RimI-like enzyme